ncbi:MAG TPA: twin-arginine translocase subunit TatC [Pirellulales bacterium]|jgi:sec-independent protein translocase protein TatC|nr:twin-arginine translocase subunit TatC [Pirellulales bacterium]
MASTLLGPRRDEDLFEDSTMTFGQHLEELRTALFKALAGLVIGVIAGLFLADYVVALLQRPLQAALQKYYKDKAIEDYEKLRDAWADTKKPLPYTIENLKEIIENHDVLFEINFVHPQVIRQQLGVEGHAEQGNKLDFESLEPWPLWHKVSDDPRIAIRALNPSEGFTIWMKAGLVAGAILSSPWVFYQIWAFVAAGLYPHERRYVHVFLPFSLGLFLLGAATAYLFVFGPVLDFLFKFNKSLNIDPDLRISELVGFVLMLPLGFGISFQLPLVMLFLERIGIFSVATYLSHWKISVLVIFILSAVLTPADPYSLLLMAIPLCFLYFGGVGLCRLMPAKSMQ